MFVKNKFRFGLLLIAAFLWTACSPRATNEPVQPAQAVAPAASDSPACGAFDTVPAAAQYTSAPPQLIDTASKYLATFKMAKGGEFVVELHADKAPITVNSFVFLACKGFFNGVTFHRVLDGFIGTGR